MMFKPFCLYLFKQYFTHYNLSSYSAVHFFYILMKYCNSRSINSIRRYIFIMHTVNMNKISMMICSECKYSDFVFLCFTVQLKMKNRFDK